jgi:hypothetical protein
MEWRFRKLNRQTQCVSLRITYQGATRGERMSDLRNFLERNRTVNDRLDRVIFNGSLIGQAVPEHAKTGKSIRSVKKKCEPFFESVPKFGRWCELQGRDKWEQEIEKLFTEQQ